MSLCSVEIQFFENAPSPYDRRTCFQHVLLSNAYPGDASTKLLLADSPSRRWLVTHCWMLTVNEVQRGTIEIEAKDATHASASHVNPTAS